jgi:hypothetical protein
MGFVNRLLSLALISCWLSLGLLPDSSAASAQDFLPVVMQPRKEPF